MPTKAIPWYLSFCAWVAPRNAPVSSCPVFENKSTPQNHLLWFKHVFAQAPKCSLKPGFTFKTNSLMGWSTQVHCSHYFSTFRRQGTITPAHLHWMFSRLTPVLFVQETIQSIQQTSQRWVDVTTQGCSGWMWKRTGESMLCAPIRFSVPWTILTCLFSTACFFVCLYMWNGVCVCVRERWPIGSQARKPSRREIRLSPWNAELVLWTHTPTDMVCSLYNLCSSFHLTCTLARLWKSILLKDAANARPCGFNSRLDLLHYCMQPNECHSS